MPFSIEINTLIEFLTAFVAFVTIVIIWKYRETPGVIYLIFIEIFAAIWALTYALEFNTHILEEKILWSKFSYFGIAFLPVFYFLFTTAFSQKRSWITKRKIILLCILPSLMIPLVFTNEYHNLVWTDVILNSSVNMAYYYHGPAFWIYFIFTEILIFFGLYNLISSIYRFSSLYKSQVYTLLIGSFFPVIGNLIYVSKLNPVPGFDWTPVSFVFTGVIIAFGIVRYRMFNLIPIARNKLIDTINDGILVVNRNGIIEDYNPAAIIIAESGNINIKGKLFKELFDGFEGLDINFFDNKSREITTSKNNMTFEVKVTPVENYSKKLSGNLVVFHEITKRKNIEESLRNTNNLLIQEIEKKEKLIDDLDAFAHTVAHDIKNPLSIIASSVSLLKQSFESNDTETFYDLVNMISDSSNKSIHITNELLTLANVSNNKIKTESLEMGSIFNEALKRLKNEIKKYNAKIKPPETWPKSKGYAAWLEEVWYNFISNAIKYGGEPPEISVGAEKLDDEYYKFWIKDNGNGIKKEDQKMLFNQFTRINSELIEGHGLGLSIVKRIINRLGGEVGIESTATKGGGSLFYFTLPKSE